MTPEAGCSSLDRWPTIDGDRQGINDEHDKVWILDVKGVRLLIDAFSFPGATAANHGEIQAMIDSIQIE